MRSSLEFESLNEVIVASETLLKTGYQKTGNWSLGQICFHLRLTIEKNMEGYPNWMVILGYPLRPFLRKFMLPKLLSGNSPAGVPTAGMFVPPGDVDDANEVEKLKACVEKFFEMKGPLHSHPGFGKMTKSQFAAFHTAHAAHHLKFLTPESCIE